MVQSLNTKSEYVDTATWFRGIPTYGKVLVGDKGFEFYSDNNPNDYVQIPWNEVTVVVADVYLVENIFHDLRFVLKNGSFIFAARHVKPTLRAIRKHVPANNMRRALTIWQKIKRNFTRN